MMLLEGLSVAKQPGRRKIEVETRDRIDLRAEPEWIARVMRQAGRLGISLSAYLRLAATERLERDEATEPKPTGKPAK